MMLWEHRTVTRAPVWPLPLDPFSFETVLRGMATMIPALSAYRTRLPEPIVDGGYYTKTVENRPLIGPMGPAGSFVVGALSGFGIMAACAAGELAALHVTGQNLPAYAPSFALDRYEDPDYRREIAELTDSGQI
jgi:glycine/D-amino acid oxidase-like deaminating enzyme